MTTATREAVAVPVDDGAAFGALQPLLAPRSVAVVGASDREGNLGGLAVGFLAKFGYRGSVWPVNPAGGTVRGIRAYATLRELPGVADLAIVAVPATGVADVVRACAEVGTPAAIAWAGGFAEIGPDGAARQRELEAVCRDTGVRLCGPNCIGVINTSIGLTASFSSMLAENATLTPGRVSMVSQSGGLGVMSHARAQSFGLGFRITVSCGNEASVTLPDVMNALVTDDGTRVVAVYVEGLSDPEAFVAALAEARRRGKPVVVMKGGASDASGRAALAHTGRLAGSDRIFDAIFREFAVSRVHSSEELLDVALQLASMRPDQMPAGRRVLVSTFGGGSGVVCTDQCVREGLSVPTLAPATRDRVAPLVTPLSSVANPVDFTPGMVTVARHRATLPQALDALTGAPDVDGWVFLTAGFSGQAAELADAFDAARRRSAKPICLSWQAMPAGISEKLASLGVYAYPDSARAARVMRHLCERTENLAHRIRRLDTPLRPFDWRRYLGPIDGPAVVTEDRVAALLVAAGLPVAPGRLATTADATLAAARELGYPVAMKGISTSVTHRAAAGLLTLDLRDDAAVVEARRRLDARASAIDAEMPTAYGCSGWHEVTASSSSLRCAIRSSASSSAAASAAAWPRSSTTWRSRARRSTPAARSISSMR